MAGLRWTTTVTGLSTTFGFPSILFPDVMMDPFAIGLGCVVNSSNVTYSVEHTFDAGSSVFISSAAFWFANSTISGASSNLSGNYAFAVTAIRLNVTAGSSTGQVTLTAIQAGV